MAQLSAIGGGTFWQVIATSVIMLLVLIPWFAFRALGEIIGDETLVRLFFEPRPAKPAETVSPIEQQQHEEGSRHDATADDRNTKSNIVTHDDSVITGQI